MIEFIHREGSNESELSELSGPVDILTVFPHSKHDLQLNDKLTVMASVSREIDFHDAAATLPDLGHLCRLVNNADKKKTITPARYFYDRNVIEVIFDFGRDGDLVHNVYNDNGKRESAACWHLSCKESADHEDDIYFRL